MARPSFKHLLQRGLLWHAANDSAGQQHRLLIQKIPFGIQAVDSELGGGLARGTVHEFFSKEVSQHSLPHCTLPTAIAIKALQHSECAIALWIGKRSWPTPFLIQAIESNPAIFSRCLFLDPPSRAEHLWAIETALRSHGVCAIVADVQKISFRLSQRFAIAARSTHCTALLLRPSTEQALNSAARSRWSIAPHISPSIYPRWKLDLCAIKGSALPRARAWIIELQCTHWKCTHWGEEERDHESALPFALFPVVVDQCGDAARAGHEPISRAS